jgi:hypothetical protein
MLAMAQTAPAEADIGAEPTMEQFTALAETELLSKAPNLKEVTFKWPYRLSAGPAGYFTCGMIATHRGRAPQEDIWVSAAVANGKVVDAQWSTLNGMLAWDCKRKVRAGTFIAG